MFNSRLRAKIKSYERNNGWVEPVDYWECEYGHGGTSRPCWGCEHVKRIRTRWGHGRDSMVSGGYKLDGSQSDEC